MKKKKKKISEANKKRTATRKETQGRHAGMIVKTFETKIQKNKLNKETKVALPKLFLETKWLYNHLAAQEDYKTVSDKISEVPVLVKDKYEIRELNYLSSQMKQGVITRFANNIKGLAVKKSHGETVGKLKFKSRIDSIPLKQHGNTFEILDDRHIHVQGIKQKIHVDGLLQFILENEYEIGPAKLIQKGGNYFFHITVFFDPKHYGERYPTPEPNSHIGGDFGISSALTLSNGVKIDFNLQPTEKFKKEQRKFSKLVVAGKQRDKELAEKEKQRKAEAKNKKAEKQAAEKEKPKVSKEEQAKHNTRKNYYKQLNKLNKEREHINNQKKDVRNKVVNNLNQRFELMSTQNENFQGWKHLFGKKMFNMSLGRMRADLAKKAAIHSEVDRFYPTTQECCDCGHRQKVKLDERIIECNSCHIIYDRDLRSAITIDEIGIYNLFGGYIPVECRRTPVGDNAAAELVDDLNRIPHVHASLVAELGSRTAFSGR